MHDAATRGDILDEAKRAFALMGEAIDALSNPPADGDGWPPMADAPRDGSYILAIVAPGRGRHLEHQAGRMFVIRHEGFAPGGFDLGWAVYPGFGGCTDHDFTCWTRLPKHPFSDAASQIGEQPC
jgi:hypothetical protein